MGKRFVSIWFRHLTTDWFALRNPELRNVAFALKSQLHGRMIVAAANELAQSKGITAGMALADARAIVPDLEVLDEQTGLAEKLLRKIAEWCIRFTPLAAADPPEGILLDATGCSHLWGGDSRYVADIVKRLTMRGYHVRAAIADTPGVAWGVARYGQPPLVINPGDHVDALLPLPPEALRLEAETNILLHKLGLHQVKQFINMPRGSLRQRFGQYFILRLDMAMGKEDEIIEPVQPVAPYHERLPCMEPITTATGIRIAVEELLNMLCRRLKQEQKGLRTAVFKCYRVDNKIETIEIGTTRPSHHVAHLMKLFELKLQTIDPGMGIDLFVLEAPKVEDHPAQQEKIWANSGGIQDARLSELIDRLSGKIGTAVIHRFVPDEHYWPEHSYKKATLDEPVTSPWRAGKLRPLQLLKVPERIEVTAPIPDYPPMLFRHKGKLHKVIKADGPERIEQEWWIQQGRHRDYFRVEDDEGNRYWLFRSGHYDDKQCEWYLHGYFA